MLKALVSLWSCVLLLLSFGASGATVIRLAHDSPESSPVHQSMLFFQSELEKRSNGDLKVEIYPARQLGDVHETTELVQQNNLQMTFGASVLLAPYIPEFNVLDLFYLFDNEEQAHLALDSDQIGKPLLKAMESKGFYGLGFMEAGFRSVSNSQHPIKQLADFKGLKIRAASNPVQIKAWKSIGTLPIPLAWGEIFTSLQQGLINTQESALYSMYSERFYEAQKYLSLTNHTYTNYVWFMNKAFWDSLSKEQQALITSVSQQTIRKERVLARAQNEKAIALLKAKGLQVNTVDPQVKQAMKALMNQAVYKSLRKRTGAALFDRIVHEVDLLKNSSNSK